MTVGLGNVGVTLLQWGSLKSDCGQGSHSGGICAKLAGQRETVTAQLLWSF